MNEFEYRAPDNWPQPQPGEDFIDVRFQSHTDSAPVVETQADLNILPAADDFAGESNGEPFDSLQHVDSSPAEGGSYRGKPSRPSNFVRRERSHLVSNLERLHHNLYIAHDDPLYWQKKLHYQRNDFHALFQLAQWREQEGKLEQALALYRRAERAAKGENQFVRAVYRRKRLERQMTALAGLSLPSGRVIDDLASAGFEDRRRFVPSRQMGGRSSFAPVNGHSVPSSTGRLPAPSAIRESAAPVYALQRPDRSTRWWMGLSGLLFGLVVGLLAALWLLQFRLEIHVDHRPETEAPTEKTAETAVRSDLWMLQHPFNETGAQAAKPWAYGEAALTYLRSAVLGYYRLNGTFPERLEVLAGPFPDNYISAIPPDPVFGERKVVTHWDGTGGWLYVKPKETAANVASSLSWQEEGNGRTAVLENAGSVDVHDPALLATVAQAVRPNWKISEDGAFSSFHPLRVFVVPDERRVMLVAGTRVLFDAPVAVGQPQTPTPTGNFFVRKRVWHPLAETFPPNLNVYLHDGVRLPYGVAGLEFADDYAIHGTSDFSSIGQAVTKGCLRVDNELMGQLFAWTPLGIDVVIVHGSAVPWAQPLWPNEDAKIEFDRLAAALQPRDDEHDGTGIYAWKG